MPSGVIPVKQYLAHVRQNKEGSFVIHTLKNICMQWPTLRANSLRHLDMPIGVA